MLKFRRGARALAGLALLAGVTMMSPSTASATHIVCGQLVTTSITLDSNLGPCPGDGLIVVADNVTIDLNGFEVFAANGAGDHAGIRLRNATGASVRNGTVQGFDAGVYIEDGGGNTVRDMTLQDNVNDQSGAPCDLGDGVAIRDSSDNRVLGNQVRNNGPYGGISVITDSDRNLISGNVVLDHNLRSRPESGCGSTFQDQGIRIEGPGADDNSVENNRVEESGLAGIGLYGEVCRRPGNTGTIVRRNTIINNEQDGIAFLQQGPAAVVCPAYASIIERNISSDNGGDGIFVASNSHDNVISHNVVSDNEQAGIGLNDPRFDNRFTNVGPTLLDLVSPDRPPYVEGTDYRVMPGSGSGDVTANVVPVDIRFAPGANAGNNPQPVDTSTSGCERADYVAAGFRAGDIALIQRGTCTFVSKVNLAIANGASAVIMFNEGQAPTRTTSNFGFVDPVTIPAVSTSYAVGFELYNLTQAGAVTAHVVTNTTNVQTMAAPAPFDNTLVGNQGFGNGEVDGYDGNLERPCDNNKWRASRFGTVNQPCVLGPGGSGAAKGRSGQRPGNLDHGMEAGEARGRSAGARI